MNTVSVKQGTLPLLLAMPHCSTWMPAANFARLNGTGRRLADTDWHIDRLYEGLIEGASQVCANFSRYLVDANRDPAGQSLYPGQNTTGLCPLVDFDGAPIYREGQEPTAEEIADRVSGYHAPYHEALTAELERLHALHGSVVLYDCHSIRSIAPFLFEGRLPDFNIGTNNGESCAKTFENAVVDGCRSASEYSHVVNGRFRGGWTTRFYGVPGDGIHAVQMELAQSTYLETEEPPFAFDTNKARKLRAILGSILADLVDLARATSDCEGENR